MFDVFKRNQGAEPTVADQALAEKALVGLVASIKAEARAEVLAEVSENMVETNLALDWCKESRDAGYQQGLKEGRAEAQQLEATFNDRLQAAKQNLLEQNKTILGMEKQALSNELHRANLVTRLLGSFLQYVLPPHRSRELPDLETHINLSELNEWLSGYRQAVEKVQPPMGTDARVKLYRRNVSEDGDQFAPQAPPEPIRPLGGAGFGETPPTPAV